jgi:hypothetical protein
MPYFRIVTNKRIGYNLQLHTGYSSSMEKFEEENYYEFREILRRYVQDYLVDCTVSQVDNPSEKRLSFIRT